MTSQHLIPILGLALATGLLASCTTIPVADAERQCALTSAQGGSNSALTVGIGAGNVFGYGGGGFGGFGVGGNGVGVEVSGAVPQNRDPAAAYDSCVRRKSGQPPVTPFAARPELKG